MSASLTIYARTVARSLSRQMAKVVAVQAVRLDGPTHVPRVITESAALDRNLLPKTAPQDKTLVRARRQAAMAEASESSELTLWLTDTSERRSANAAAREAMEGAFSTLGEVHELNVRDRRYEAFRIPRDVGLPARLKLNDRMRARSTFPADEQATARAAAAQEADGATYLLIGLVAAGLPGVMALAGPTVVPAMTRPLTSPVGLPRRMARREVKAEIRGTARGDEIGPVVEGQGTPTREIVRNVAQASTGTLEVTSNIASVAGASEGTGAAAGQALASTSGLSRQSEPCSIAVGRLPASVRAA